MRSIDKASRQRRRELASRSLSTISEEGPAFSDESNLLASERSGALDRRRDKNVSRIITSRQHGSSGYYESIPNSNEKSRELVGRRSAVECSACGKGLATINGIERHQAERGSPPVQTKCTEDCERITANNDGARSEINTARAEIVTRERSSRRRRNEESVKTTESDTTCSVVLVSRPAEKSLVPICDLSIPRNRTQRTGGRAEVLTSTTRGSRDAFLVNENFCITKRQQLLSEPSEKRQSKRLALEVARLRCALTRTASSLEAEQAARQQLEVRKPEAEHVDGGRNTCTILTICLLICVKNPRRELPLW